MLILKTVLAVFFIIGLSEAVFLPSQCQAGNAFISNVETTISIANQGCHNYLVGPVFSQSNIILALTNNQLACDKGQSLQVLNSNWELMYDVCAYQKSGVSTHWIKFTGSFVVLQFSNSLAQILSSFIHYGLFNQLPPLPTKPTIAAPTTTVVAPTTTVAPITTGLPASTASTATCGKPSYAPITTGMKIVGGFQAVPYSLPWQVLILLRTPTGTALCGGSLISNQWIVTAAHCTEKVSSATVYLGIYYRDQINKGTALGIRVSKIIVNPNWNTNTFKNDIAMMKLSTPVTFNDKIQPICLPTSNLATAGHVVMVSGWGDTSYNGALSNPLLENTIPVQSMSYCGFPNTESVTQICAGDFANRKDTCQGDSGGPLATQNSNGQFVLSGVVSYGGPCDGKGIYTNVLAYTSWIQQIMATQ